MTTLIASVVAAFSGVGERARDEEGAELVQVGIVMAFIAVVAVLVMGLINGGLSNLGSHVVTLLSNVVSSTP
jgi:Flp pilus assembly pilin Flp